MQRIGERKQVPETETTWPTGSAAELVQLRGMSGGLTNLTSDRRITIATVNRLTNQSGFSSSRNSAVRDFTEILAEGLRCSNETQLVKEQESNLSFSDLGSETGTVVGKRVLS